MNRTFLILFSLLLALPASAHAARFYFVVPSVPVHVGDAVAVELMLDPEGEDVNAVEGTVLVSDNLAVTGIREEGSVVPLWVERPGAEGRSSAFSGIIPGGFRGVLSPFWEGGHPGNVYTLLLRATGEGAARITLGPSGRVFRNDGKGTAVPVSADDAILTIRPGGEAQPEPAPDTVQPEEFVPEIASSPDVFDGDFFVAFAANDLESGIDHYEVAETYTPRPRGFVRAESPYRLTSQGQRAYVHVKAVDRAGNERVVTLSPANPRPSLAPWGLGILVLLLLLGAGLAIFRHRSIHAR